MKLRLAALVLVLAATAAAQDVGSFSVPQPTRMNRVIALDTDTVHVRAGGKAKAEIGFRVLPGFHINSNKPGSELLLPTELNLSPPTDLSVGGVKYPEGTDFSISVAPTEKLKVYSGQFQVTALVSAARNIPAGTYRIHGFLKYQACDDRACYAPARLPIGVDVTVTRNDSRKRHNPPQSPHVHN